MPQPFSKIWIIGAVLIILAGGIFAWQYFGTSEEITNWKTYKNEDIGFEIKYPSDLKEEWKIPEESFTLHEAWGEQIGKRLLLFSMTDSDKIYGFGFSIYSNFRNLILEEFSQKLMEWMKLECHLKTTENIFFEDKQTPGVKFIFDNCNSARTPDEIINQVLIKENNNIIEISGIGSLSNSEFIKRFNLILSSFSFIETQGEEMADWKTYKNEEYGFEIKYPSDFFIENYQDGLGFVEKQYQGQQVHYPFVGVEFIKTPFSAEQWVNENGTEVNLLDENLPPGFDRSHNYLYYGVKDKEIRVINSLQFFQFYNAGISGSNNNAFVRTKDSTVLINIYRHSSGMGEVSKNIYNQILSTFRFLE